MPPPIAFHIEHSAKADPWREAHKDKAGHGFGGASADALFHLLSGDSAADGRDGLPPALYSLVAFEFGRHPPTRVYPRVYRRPSVPALVNSPLLHSHS